MFAALPVALKVTLIQHCMLFLNHCKEMSMRFSMTLFLTFNFQTYNHSINTDHIQKLQDRKNCSLYSLTYCNSLKSTFGRFHSFTRRGKACVSAVLFRFYWSCSLVSVVVVHLVVSHLYFLWKALSKRLEGRYKKVLFTVSGPTPAE